MQQIRSKENCMLYLGKGIDVDQLNPHTIYAPGSNCLNCSVRTGVPGVDAYGVIRLPHGLGLNENREVVYTIRKSSRLRTAYICIYQCRIPKNVEIKPELATQ